MEGCGDRDGESEVQSKKIGRITDRRSEERRWGMGALLRVFSKLVANKGKGAKGLRSGRWGEDGIVSFVEKTL